MSSRRTILGFLLSLGLLACASPDPLTPSAKEQRRLQAHVDRVFAGTDAPLADRDAVRAVHRLAYWVRAYHAATGQYPLADHVGDANFVQVIVYGDDSFLDYDNPVNVQRGALLDALREALGGAIALPEDPDPTDFRCLHYSTNGRGFTIACDLASPVNGGEMVSADQGQYRVASHASDALPILDYEAILSGELTSLPPVRWRDPSLAR